jgi:hypothetical protein
VRHEGNIGVKGRSGEKAGEIAEPPRLQPSLGFGRICHIPGGTCDTLGGRAALPRRPELGRSSSFALPDYLSIRVHLRHLRANAFSFICGQSARLLEGTKWHIRRAYPVNTLPNHCTLKMRHKQRFFAPFAPFCGKSSQVIIYQLLTTKTVFSQLRSIKPN